MEEEGRMLSRRDLLLFPWRIGALHGNADEKTGQGEQRHESDSGQQLSNQLSIMQAGLTPEELVPSFIYSSIIEKSTHSG